jgi:predicted  nucleic acid-binding Zn-ribbon protein
MTTVDNAEASLAAARTTLKQAETDWAAEQERLGRLRQEAGDELTELRERRSPQSALLDAGTLQIYDTLRAARGGRAVAKVERGTCQGCRISLPMSQLQKARGGPTGANLARCSSCERILYVT